MKRLFWIAFASLTFSLAEASYIFNPKSGSGNQLTCGNVYYILPDITTQYTLSCPGNCLTILSSPALLLETAAYLLFEDSGKLLLQ